jgi:hypothetical protein
MEKGLSYKFRCQEYNKQRFTNAVNNKSATNQVQKTWLWPAPVKPGVNCIQNFFVSPFPFSTMVFNGKRETRNGMEIFTYILPQSA